MTLVDQCVKRGLLVQASQSQKMFRMDGMPPKHFIEAPLNLFQCASRH